MKNFIICLLFIFLSISSVHAYSENKKEYSKDIILSNRLFSLTLPSALKEFYCVNIKKDSIAIFDKSSKKAGFGGFVFAIKAYKTPAEHAMSVGSRKIGELTDKKGQIYDIVITYPTDVQFDYVSGRHDSYDKLYKLGSSVLISGTKGSNYYKDKGMKGEDLYKEVLQKHVKALKEKWDSSKLEEENMSYMYNVLSSGGTNVLDKVGYAYYDANADGIDELFIGEIANGEWKGVVYDIYTMIDRKPVHVVSGGSRNRYFVCDDAFICKEYSSGAGESGKIVYILVENSTELFPQVGFKYDEYSDKKNPWFISYQISEDEWDKVSEDTYNKRKKIFNRYNRFEYIPLSALSK